MLHVPFIHISKSDSIPALSCDDEISHCLDSDLSALQLCGHSYILPFLSALISPSLNFSARK
jgi:hypothetical protein